jgi:hypothetical protein
VTIDVKVNRLKRSPVEQVVFNLLKVDRNTVIISLIHACDRGKWSLQAQASPVCLKAVAIGLIANPQKNAGETLLFTSKSRM